MKTLAHRLDDPNDPLFYRGVKAPNGRFMIGTGLWRRINQIEGISIAQSVEAEQSVALVLAEIKALGITGKQARDKYIHRRFIELSGDS